MTRLDARLQTLKFYSSLLVYHFTNTFTLISQITKRRKRGQADVHHHVHDLSPTSKSPAPPPPLKTMTTPPAPTLTQLLTSLTTSTTYALPTPHPSFLQPVLNSSSAARASSNSVVNLASLTATARHRILASDISLPLILDPDTAAVFPVALTDRRRVHASLPHDVFCQVREVEDVGRSRWEQVEALEAERKGEMVKGREVIRVVPGVENGEGVGGGGGGGGGGESSTAATGTGTQQPSSTSPAASAPAVSKGPFMLQLQDRAGTRIQAFEMQKVAKVGYPPLMGIGCKIWLKRGTRIARGVVLLEPGLVDVVGGRVETWDKRWREERETRLREEVKQESELAGEGSGGNG